MKATILLLVLLGSALARAADNESAEDSLPSNSKQTPTLYPTNVLVQADVSYLGPARDDKADIYSPLQLSKNERLPAIIIIHGGGFNIGDKARSREINIATNLVLHGYICMSINYQLWREPGQVTWPQCVYDAKAAVRWLRKNADRLGVDPAHIGVIGGSAGGNLAAMLALTRPTDGFDLNEPWGGFSSAVNCAVDFYGPVQLMDYHDMKCFGKTRAEAPELYKKASPVSYVRKDAPPLLIVHGTKDTTVPISQSQTLDDALTKVGAEHQLVIVQKAWHSFDLQPRQRDLRPLVFAFFDQHLKPAAPKVGQ